MRRLTEPDEIIDFFLAAYSQGAFPMAEVAQRPRRDGGIRTAQSIRWYCPNPRAVLPLTDGALRIPRTVRRTLRKLPVTLTSDAAFERVIRACAIPGPTRGGAWLDNSLIRCYTLLHERGMAHSVEAWHSRAATEQASTPRPTDAALLGGVYGVSLGAAFFAESMFSAIDSGGSGASSACLIALWNHLRDCGYELLDVQIANAHTLRFGVVRIPHAEYMRRLEAALAKPDRWKPLPAQP
jgi:leucyl/phenylalanyl-tRNA--protein transferase